MSYALVRSVHIVCVVLSVALFALRGVMQLQAIDWRRRRWLRILPHANDTLLLAAGITLAVMSRQYPFVEPWLTAKVLALALYIALGMFALSPRRSRRSRTLAFAAALATVGYIIAAAVTRSPYLGLVH